MNKSRTVLASVVAGIALLSGLEAPALAAGKPTPPSATDACPKEPNRYLFTKVVNSLRPTNLKSDYITGPGTVSYTKTSTATVNASMTATVSAEAGVVFAKASSSIGVTVGASYSWSQAFTYSLEVPAGQRRRMRLSTASKAFVVTKQVFSTGLCRYTTVYSAPTNAPRLARDDEWRLEA